MSNFFEELKKRNVYKVDTAYAIGGWLIMQVVGTLGDNLGWVLSELEMKSQL